MARHKSRLLDFLYNLLDLRLRESVNSADEGAVRVASQPIENGRSCEDTSYLYPKTARVESRLLRVVFADGTHWEAH